MKVYIYTGTQDRIGVIKSKLVIITEMDILPIVDSYMVVEGVKRKILDIEFDVACDGSFFSDTRVPSGETFVNMIVKS